MQYFVCWAWFRPIKDRKPHAKEIAAQLAIGYDRLKELKAFDGTKSGVKGLVDAGITNLSQNFILPPEELIEELNTAHLQVQVPVINLKLTKGR